MVLLRPPHLFHGLLSLLRPLLDEHTASKIAALGSADAVRRFCENLLEEPVLGWVLSTLDTHAEPQNLPQPFPTSPVADHGATTPLPDFCAEDAASEEERGEDGTGGRRVPCTRIDASGAVTVVTAAGGSASTSSGVEADEHEDGPGTPAHSSATPRASPWAQQHEVRTGPEEGAS